MTTKKAKQPPAAKKAARKVGKAAVAAEINLAADVDQNFDAPIVRIDSIQGFLLTLDGQVRFNAIENVLLTPRHGTVIEDAPIARRVSARFVTSLDQFVKIQQWMTKLVQEMKDEGAISEQQNGEQDG